MGLYTEKSHAAVIKKVPSRGFCFTYSVSHIEHFKQSAVSRSVLQHGQKSLNSSPSLKALKYILVTVNKNLVCGNWDPVGKIIVNNRSKFPTATPVNLLPSINAISNKRHWPMVTGALSYSGWSTSH